MDIYFQSDISDRLEALRQSNERLLTLVEALGADSRDIALVRAAVRGTLADVAVSFGLHRQSPDFVAILEGAGAGGTPPRFPVVTTLLKHEEGTTDEDFPDF